MPLHFDRKCGHFGGGKGKKTGIVTHFDADMIVYLPF